MNNVSRITQSGVCTGCGARDICEHIRFSVNASGFPAPVVDEDCTDCGKCVDACIFDPLRDGDDE